jgi:hypothetical protein
MEFFNQFAIFFYIGLVKGAIDGCIVYDEDMGKQVLRSRVDISGGSNIDMAMCSEELRDYVKNVLFSFFFMNIIEITLPAVFLPWLRRCMRKKVYDDSHQETGSTEFNPEYGWTMSAVVQGMLNKEMYSSSIEESGTYDDYIEIMVYFGHVSLFSLVFPFAPLIVLVLLIMELRVDGHKLFYTMRRPLPKNAGSIGAWHFTFQFITWVSVITNSLILVWGMDNHNLSWVKDAAPGTKWFMIMCIILLLVVFKSIIIIGVPDVPTAVSTLVEHRKWVCQQLSSNNVAMNPRHIILHTLDTCIHSVYSEHRSFTVNAIRTKARDGTEFVTSRANSSASLSLHSENSLRSFQK